ncbi:MAG: EamA family transporter [Nocardioidaceae bacterium]
MVGGRVRSELATTTYTFLCYSTSAVLLLLACAVGRAQVWGFDTSSWLLIIAVTVAAQLLGHTVFNHLLATMSPTLVSITLLLEVPGAALLAAVFLGQAPPVAVYAGLSLICVGLAIVVTSRSQAVTPAEAPSTDARSGATGSLEPAAPPVRALARLCGPRLTHQEPKPSHAATSAGTTSFVAGQGRCSR